MSEIWLSVREGKFDKDKAMRLRRALEMRETSDYDPISEFSPEEASGLLNDAVEFVAYVRSILENTI